jgi:hypothetical protein
MQTIQRQILKTSLATRNKRETEFAPIRQPNRVVFDLQGFGVE